MRTAALAVQKAQGVRCNVFDFALLTDLCAVQRVGHALRVERDLVPGTTTPHISVPALALSCRNPSYVSISVPSHPHPAPVSLRAQASRSRPISRGRERERERAKERESERERKRESEPASERARERERARESKREQERIPPGPVEDFSVYRHSLRHFDRVAAKILLSFCPRFSTRPGQQIFPLHHNPRT
eukprot:1607713-Rhodomonas_salina.1